MTPLEEFISSNHLDEESLSLVNEEVESFYDEDEVGETYWVKFTTPCKTMRYRINLYYEPHVSYSNPIRFDIFLLLRLEQNLDGSFSRVGLHEDEYRISVYRMSEYNKDCHKILLSLLGYRPFPF